MCVNDHVSAGEVLLVSQSGGSSMTLLTALILTIRDVHVLSSAVKTTGIGFLFIFVLYGSHGPLRYNTPHLLSLALFLCLSFFLDRFTIIQHDSY